MVQPQGIVDKYHFSKRWFYLYGEYMTIWQCYLYIQVQHAVAWALLLVQGMQKPPGLWSQPPEQLNATNSMLQSCMLKADQQSLTKTESAALALL